MKFPTSLNYYWNDTFLTTPTRIVNLLKNNTPLFYNKKTVFGTKIVKLITQSIKPISIVSKYKTPFILSPIGFIFLQNIYTQTSNYIKARLNKFRYSFLFKNDLKRYLLKKPGKLKLISSSIIFNNYKDKYNRFGKTFINSYFSQNLNQIEPHTHSTSMNNILTSQTPFFSYKNTRKYDNYLGSFFKKEVRIKRIKFKPGYSRL
jgi:hypothetical protein